MNRSESCRKAGQVRAKKFTKEQLTAWGKKGAARLREKYGAAVFARRLANHARNNPGPLVKMVCGWLDEIWMIDYSLGVELVPGRIYPDIVLYLPNGRLVVECDEHEWHRNSGLAGHDKEQRDLERQHRIEGLGYSVLRLTQAEILDQSGRSKLYRKLTEMGIPTWE